MHTAVVGVGFNQSELIITEGTTTEVVLCTEVTSGTLQRNITVHLETVTSAGSGNLKMTVSLISY